MLMLSLFAALLTQDVSTQVVEYKQGDVVLEGFLAWPKDAKGKLPGVLICHQWMGMRYFSVRSLLPGFCMHNLWSRWEWEIFFT